MRVAAATKTRNVCFLVSSGGVMIMADAYMQPCWCVAKGNHTAQEAR